MDKKIAIFGTALSRNEAKVVVGGDEFETELERKETASSTEPCSSIKCVGNTEQTQGHVV